MKTKRKQRNANSVPAVVIKPAPVELKQALRDEARANKRSASAQALVILERHFGLNQLVCQTNE